MRRMIPRRTSAVLVAGALALTGAVVLAAPAAHAVEVTYMSQCKNKLAPGLEIPPSETKVDIQVSPVKDKYAVGDTVTVTWKWGSYSKVPDSSPLEKIDKDSTKPVGQINMTGAQTGVLVVEGERKNAETPRGSELVVTDMTGTLTLTAAGTLDLAPKQHSTFTLFGTLDAETECLPLSTPGVSASLTVESGGPVELPVVNAPDTPAKPGDTITLTGANFAPGATPQLSLCNGDGTNCLADRFTANTLAIDASGNLTGTATLAGTGLADGAYQVRVSDGTREAKDGLEIKASVPTEPRTAVPSVQSGPLGTVVGLTGENWTPNRALNVSGVDADGGTLLPVVNVRSTADGKFTAEYPVTAPELKQIRVREGGSTTNLVLVDFTILAGGSQSTQEPTVTLAAGALTMSQAGDGINFGSATLNGAAQTLNASLNQVTVTDARGGNLGWSLTGTMTDLVAANGTDKIPGKNISWTPSCAATAGSLSQVASGTAGPLGSAAATLCSVTPSGGTTGGKFTADAQLALTTPQFAAAGTYTGTLTLSLI